MRNMKLDRVEPAICDRQGAFGGVSVATVLPCGDHEHVAGEMAGLCLARQRNRGEHGGDHRLRNEPGAEFLHQRAIEQDALPMSVTGLRNPHRRPSHRAHLAPGLPAEARVTKAQPAHPAQITAPNDAPALSRTDSCIRGYRDQSWSTSSSSADPPSITTLSRAGTSARKRPSLRFRSDRLAREDR